MDVNVVPNEEQEQDFERDPDLVQDLLLNTFSTQETRFILLPALKLIRELQREFPESLNRSAQIGVLVRIRGTCTVSSQWCHQHVQLHHVEHVVHLKRQRKERFFTRTDDPVFELVVHSDSMFSLRYLRDRLRTLTGIWRARILANEAVQVVQLELPLLNLGLSSDHFSLHPSFGELLHNAVVLGDS